MSRAYLTKSWAMLVIVLVSVSAVGGYVYWSYMQPKAFSTVSGLVHLDEPVVGATVSVYARARIPIVPPSLFQYIFNFLILTHARSQEDF